jgi:hypothetical protein
MYIIVHKAIYKQRVELETEILILSMQPFAVLIYKLHLYFN